MRREIACLKLTPTEALMGGKIPASHLGYHRRHKSDVLGSDRGARNHSSVGCALVFGLKQIKAHVSINMLLNVHQRRVLLVLK